MSTSEFQAIKNPHQRENLDIKKPPEGGLVRN